MIDSTSRPKRGLPPAEALARWSDQAAYAELIALAGRPNPPPLGICEESIKDPKLLREYNAKRRAVETAFRQLLIDGTVLVSAIAESSDSREVLNPSLWELIDIEYGFGDAGGDSRIYHKPEFFEHAAIPLNVRSIPDWLDAELGARGLNEFRHDRDYRHIVLHGMSFNLSPLHAKIVGILHKAWLDGHDDGWRLGPDVLEEAGSSQLKMGDVFKTRKDWKSFIELDGKGMYRLRMGLPEPDESGPK